MTAAVRVLGARGAMPLVQGARLQLTWASQPRDIEMSAQIIHVTEASEAD